MGLTATRATRLGCRGRAMRMARLVPRGRLGTVRLNAVRMRMRMTLLPIGSRTIEMPVVGTWVRARAGTRVRFPYLHGVSPGAFRTRALVRATMTRRPVLAWAPVARPLRLGLARLARVRCARVHWHLFGLHSSLRTSCSSSAAGGRSSWTRRCGGSTAPRTSARGVRAVGVLTACPGPSPWGPDGPIIAASGARRHHPCRRRLHPCLPCPCFPCPSLSLRPCRLPSLLLCCSILRSTRLCPCPCPRIASC